MIIFFVYYYCLLLLLQLFKILRQSTIMTQLFKVTASRKKSRIFVFEDKPTDAIAVAPEPPTTQPNVRIYRSCHLKFVPVTKCQERSKELWVEN
jgi:uncharacterized membrane protein